MPQPTSGESHVDSILSNISVAYAQRQTQFVASRIFPVVPVEKQSDKYFTFNKNDWFRDEAMIRPENTESVGSGYNLSTDNYFADVWALHKDVSWRTIKNADNPLDPERTAAEFVARRILLRLETQWVADFFATGIWGTDAAPGVTWDNIASDPIGDIDTGITTMLAATGFAPNTLTMDYRVFTALRKHPDIVDRFKYTNSATITEDILARLFGVERVFVFRAIKATNVEGETAAYGFQTGKHALLTYSPEQADVLTPSAGYTFMWEGVGEDIRTTIGTKVIPIPTRETNRVESQAAFDNKVVAADLGYFLPNAVA